MRKLLLTFLLIIPFAGYSQDLILLRNGEQIDCKITKVDSDIQSQHSNYYLTGTLNSFYAEQEFSTGAAVGASFGLIGAIATAGIKTPGTIIIDISELKLYKKDGSLVKDFGNFYKEYKDDFKADANCWCAYWNANEMLKDFNMVLIEKIRNDMADIEL